MKVTQKEYDRQLNTYKVWFEMLKLSPSFNYAHKHANNLLTAHELSNPPVEYELVRETYNDFKGIVGKTFNQWFEAGGKDMIDLPVVYRSTKTSRSTGKITVVDNLKQLASMSESDLLVSISLTDTNTTALLTQLRDVIASRIDSVDDTTIRPKYCLNSTKFRLDNLEKYVRLLTLFAKNPKIKLLEAGLIAGVSLTHTLQNSAKLDNDAKGVVRVMATKSANVGITVMEHAARGRFPCFDDFNHGVTRKTLNK